MREGSAEGARPRLEARGLACVRGGRVLFRGLGLAVGAGELLLVEGPNGAGKTTLLRVLCGLREPEAGEVRWAGLPLRRAGMVFRASVVYVGHAPGLKDDLTALENLAVAAALGGRAPAIDPREALARVGLGERAHVRAGALSAGQRRRLGLARLLVRPASLWVLDEPLSAVDRAGAGLVADLLRGHLDAGGLAVVTSHAPLGVPGERVRTLRLEGGAVTEGAA